jgi:serine/threonine protein kinase
LGTGNSKHGLAHKQKKYQEAEQILYQAVQGREQTFGQDDGETLNSKHLLACALYVQKEYARKRVPRKAVLGRRGIEALKGMIAEIEVMKKLKHHHMVELVGSYTDPRYLSVIMSPVAEQDLATYLEKASSSQYPEIRTFFGCLATGLQFLHARQIRHKDIKPSNILVINGNVLFTDFGLALDFTDASGSTTTGMVTGMTPRYCAPEVALQEPRNTSSDIWCLGIVFLEMLVVLKGRTMQWMDDFLATRGSQQIFVRLNPTGLVELMAELAQTAHLSNNKVLVWIQQMLQEKHTSRPTAANLVTSITLPYGQGGAGTVFCGICCLVPAGGDSDTSDDLEENEVLGDLAFRLR